MSVVCTSNKQGETVARVARLEKVVAAGLPPTIGNARLDDFIFGIRNTGRLLTVCFCCECCCLTRWFKYSPIEETGKFMHRLEGLEISVDEDKCTQCQTCQDHCFLDLISFDGETPIISEHCMVCGRCASACPNDAIQIRLNNPEFVERAVQCISSYVKA